MSARVVFVISDVWPLVVGVQEYSQFSLGVPSHSLAEDFRITADSPNRDD